MKEKIINNEKIHKLLFLITLFLSVISCEIFRLFDFLFDNIYYGYITPLLIDILRIIAYILITVFACKYAKKNFKEIDYIKSKELSLKSVTILYLLTIITIFIVTAILKFKLKLVADLGENIGSIAVYINLTSIVCNLARIPITMLIIRYSEDLINSCIDLKYTKYISFGGIVALLTIGLFEFILFSDFEFIDVLFLIFNILYGYIYRLSYKNYKLSMIICMIIRLL